MSKFAIVAIIGLATVIVVLSIMDGDQDENMLAPRLRDSPDSDKAHLLMPDDKYTESPFDSNKGPQIRSNPDLFNSSSIKREASTSSSSLNGSTGGHEKSQQFDTNSLGMPLLHTESRLIARHKRVDSEVEERSIDGRASRTVLTDEAEFDATLEKFLADEIESSNAIELSNAYRSIFDSYHDEFQMGAAFELQDISCGSSICIGSANVAQSPEIWSEFQEYFDSTSSGVRTFLSLSSPYSDEFVQYRFIFSTDPWVDGVTVEPQP